MVKSKVFQCTSITIILAILVSNIIQNTYSSFLVLLLLGVLFLNYYNYYKKYSLELLIIFFSAMIGIGISAHHTEQINRNFDYIHQLENKTQSIEYKISTLIKKSNEKQTYKAKLIQINNLYVKDKDIYFHINTPPSSRLETNKLYRSQTKLYLSSKEKNKSYYNYLLSQKVYFQVYISQYENIYDYHKYYIIEKIKKLRKIFLREIHTIYPQNEALFLGGILVGAREELPEKLKENFNNSGLTHFIAVSGFNITIIIIFIGLIITYFPKYLKLLFISSGVIGFVIFVGITAPVIRSAIMGLLGYYILISGRKASPINILLASGLIMILLNPYTLNYDVSFQLSFLAVLGILYCNNYLEKVFHFLPSFLAIKEAFILTLGAFIFTVPIVVVNFGQMSIISPLANILVSWTIPIAMLGGFISVIVNLVYSEISIIFSYLTWVFLKFDILIVNLFGEFSPGVYKVDFGEYGGIFSFLYYSILIFLFIYFKEEEKKQTD